MGSESGALSSAFGSEPTGLDAIEIDDFDDGAFAGEDDNMLTSRPALRTQCPASAMEVEMPAQAGQSPTRSTPQQMAPPQPAAPQPQPEPPQPPVAASPATPDPEPQAPQMV